MFRFIKLETYHYVYFPNTADIWNSNFFRLVWVLNVACNFEGRAQVTINKMLRNYIELGRIKRAGRLGYFITRNFMIWTEIILLGEWNILGYYGLDMWLEWRKLGMNAEVPWRISWKAASFKIGKEMGV
jgi:hypothetical protein